MTSLVPSVPDMPRSRVPDFFMVGHPKSGSTALFRMLRAHPQIFMPAKEPWFFAAAAGEFAPRPAGAGRTPATLEEYLALFAHATPEQRIGEGSTSYLMSPFAAQRLAELQPAARVVAVIREPASFLRSLHLQLVQNHTETERNLLRAIALEAERLQGRRVPPGGYWTLTTQYSEHVRYVEQLRRYEEYFPTEQLHVIVYDDFRADNRATGQELLRFLGVDPAVAVEVPEANPSVQIRFHRLHELIHAVANTRAVRASAKALAPYGFSQERAVELRNRALYRKAPALDTRQLDELRKRYKHEVEALSEHLDRDLVALWGYDQV